jgi:flavin-dependent dehydrogenase
MAVKHFEADIIVAGAGTAGCYFAWRMGQAGFKTLVLEAKTLTSLGEHIEIFHMDKIRFDEFNIPHPTPEELIHTEDTNYTWSPDMKVKQTINYTFYVMSMPTFIQRMQRYVRDSGGTIVEHAKISDVIMEGKQLIGVKGEVNGEPFEARGKLVVDASGLAAAVRTRLPANFGVEIEPVPPADCLYVCLELRDEIPDGFPTGSNSYLFHKAFWNKSWGEGAILGIGQPGSFDYAWKKHQEWREEYFDDPGKVLRRRQGVVPYHRPSYSLVGNGFMVVGDAANQNKPFSGEGVTSGFTACQIAAEVASAALKKGEANREALWAYNVRYFRGQGAKFASGLAQLPAVAELTREDVNYLFQHNIIFSGKDFEELNTNYEIAMGAGKLISIGLALLWGVITGQFKFSSLKKFLAASGTAGQLKAHYMKFPETSAGFEIWADEARSLWGER